MPISSSVVSSAQSSTTTATFAIFALKSRGNRFSAFSTSASNLVLVIRAESAIAQAFDVDDVLDLADRLHDVLELAEVVHLDDEVIEPPAILGHGDLGPGDVALTGGDRARDLGQEARAIASDVYRDLDGALCGLATVALDGDEPLLVEHVLHDGEASSRVHGEAAAARDEPHDAVPGDRRAALAEADEQVVHPANANGALAPPRRLLCLELRLGLRLVDDRRRQPAQDLLNRGLAIADRGEQIVGRREAELREELSHLVGGEQRGRRQPVFLRLALEELAPERQRADALLDLEPLVDLGPRPRGLDDLEPVPARMLGRRGDHLHDVALPEGVAERDELAVDLRAHAVMPHVGVNGVGEVDRRGAFRQGLDVALRREDVDLVGKEIEADGVEQLAEPREGVVELVAVALLLLVEPVRGDALLRDAVHLPRPDLDLHGIAL